MSLLVLVWNLRFLSKNSILCGKSSSTYQSFKIVASFFPSSSLIPLFPFIFRNFIKPKLVPQFAEAKNWIRKSGFHQLVLELWFLKSGVVYPLCFLFHACFLLVCSVTFLFNSILLFYLPFFISLSLSFFSEVYLVSIYFYLFFINIVLRFMQKKRK